MAVAPIAAMPFVDVTRASTISPTIDSSSCAGRLSERILQSPSGFLDRLTSSAPMLPGALETAVRCDTTADFGRAIIISILRLASAGQHSPEPQLRQDDDPARQERPTLVAVPRTYFGDRLSDPPRMAETPVDLVWVGKSHTAEREFVCSIRQAIETLSRSGYPKIGETADLVGISVRTLQRRLATARLSHETLVAEARFATASEILAETDARILDVALDLGYSEHANFTRAFRRWAGCSPQAYRSRQRRPVAPASAREATHLRQNG